MTASIDRALTRIWLALAASLTLAGGLHLGAALGARPWLSVPVAAQTEAPGPRCVPETDPSVHRETGEGWNLARARP